MATATIQGYELPLDEQVRICLTEIWKLAGRPPHRRPGDFKRLSRVRQILACANWLVKRDRWSSSWAHFHLAQQYAAYVGLAEFIPVPVPNAFDALWDEHLKWREEQAHAAADSAAASAEETRQAREENEAFHRRWEEIEAEELSGEGWKGPDYNPHTAGEEWKADADATIEPPPRGMGPDHLFMDLFRIPGGPVLRASVN